MCVNPVIWSFRRLKSSGEVGEKRQTREVEKWRFAVSSCGRLEPVLQQRDWRINAGIGLGKEGCRTAVSVSVAPAMALRETAVVRNPERQSRGRFAQYIDVARYYVTPKPPNAKRSTKRMHQFPIKGKIFLP